MTVVMAAIGVGAFFAADAITDDGAQAVPQGPNFGSEGRLEADRILGQSALAPISAAVWSLPDAEALRQGHGTVVERLSEIYSANSAYVAPDAEAQSQGLSGGTLIGQLASVHSAKWSAPEADVLADFSAQGGTLIDRIAESVKKQQSQGGSTPLVR